jgi:monofunctional biosynthetic peptidoglycan transglycosylase
MKPFRPLRHLALSASLALSLALAAPSSLADTGGMDGITRLMEFEGAADEPRWVAVNDGVMGGLSRGGPRLAEGRLHFEGVLSLENNGGFSSVRTLGRGFDLSGKREMVLRVLGDGRRYQLRLATDARFRGASVSYGAEFGTTPGQWTEVRIPFADLSPSFRGYALDGPPVNLGQVEEIGLLIGDKREGSFRLAVDWIGVQ